MPAGKRNLIFIFLGLFLAAFFVLPIVFLINKEVTYRTIINDLCGREKDQEKIAVRVLDFLHDYLFAPEGAKVVDKDIYDNLVRGIAWCDQRAWALGTFLGRLGIDNRAIMTKNPQGASNHIVSELLLNGKWRFFDPYWGMAIYDDYGELASYKDICDESSLFYLSPKMKQIKNIDDHSYEMIKKYYTENVFYHNPHAPAIWGNPFKAKDLKRSLITKTLDLYIHLFGDRFSFLFQDIYLTFVLESKDHNLTYLKARNYDLFGRRELAIEAYNKFINNYPGDSGIENALLFSGILFNKVKSPILSIDALRSLLKKYPKTKWKAVAYYYLGYDYELVEDYDLAEEYYWLVIDIYKSDPAYIEYGLKAEETDVIERLSNLLSKK